MPGLVKTLCQRIPKQYAIYMKVLRDVVYTKNLLKSSTASFIKLLSKLIRVSLIA